MKTFIALTLLSSIVATPAMAESFTRDGETYTYEVKESGGDQLIVGRNLSAGQNFTLRVRNGRVSGRYNGSAVNFSTSAGVAVAAEPKLATR